MATRAQLKSYFETNDYPTQGQFWELIDQLFLVGIDQMPIASVQGLVEALASKGSAATVQAAYDAAMLALSASQRTVVKFANQQAFVFNAADYPNIVKPAIIKFWLVDEGAPGYDTNDNTTWIFKPVEAYPSFTVDSDGNPVAYTVDLGYVAQHGFYQIF